MNEISDIAGQAAARARAGSVRADFVPADHYTSPEFLRLEKERLWPKVWQVACREEEVPHVGSFVTYDIMDETIIVVRSSENQIRAFYNVCQHRGRRLADGCGQVSHFQCRFHGWRYGLDGAIQRVLDREDWDGCEDFADQDLRLGELKVGTWAGFVFINPDENAAPLTDFLDEAPRYIDPYEVEKMRYRWSASVKVPSNWKVGVEAFNESYHVSATHPQLMPTFGDDRTRNRIHGAHGMFYTSGDPAATMGTPSPRLRQASPTDLRPKIVEYYDLYHRTLGALFSERDVEATRRLLTEVGPEASFFEIITRLLEFQREAAIAAGAGWPDISLQQIMEAGTDWHLFPNLVFLPYPDGLLGYRALPHPKDPDVCYFEVFALQRYAPGAEPPFQRKIMHGDDDWRNFKAISLILQQDFDNMGEVQRGMKSKGFKGARPSPLQEGTVANFHRVLMDYLAD